MENYTGEYFKNPKRSAGDWSQFTYLFDDDYFLNIFNTRVDRGPKYDLFDNAVSDFFGVYGSMSDAGFSARKAQAVALFDKCVIYAGRTVNDTDFFFLLLNTKNVISLSPEKSIGFYFGLQTGITTKRYDSSRFAKASSDFINSFWAYFYDEGPLAESLKGAVNSLEKIVNGDEVSAFSWDPVTKIGTVYTDYRGDEAEAFIDLVNDVLNKSGIGARFIEVGVGQYRAILEEEKEAEGYVDLEEVAEIVKEVCEKLDFSVQVEVKKGFIYLYSMLGYATLLSLGSSIMDELRRKGYSVNMKADSYPSGTVLRFSNISKG